METRLPFGKRPFEFKKRDLDDDNESQEQALLRSTLPPSVIFVKKSKNEIEQIPLVPSIPRNNGGKEFQDPITSISDELLSLMHSSDEIFQQYNTSGHLHTEHSAQDGGFVSARSSMSEKKVHKQLTGAEDFINESIHKDYDAADEANTYVAMESLPPHASKGESDALSSVYWTFPQDGSSPNFTSAHSLIDSASLGDISSSTSEDRPQPNSIMNINEVHGAAEPVLVSPLNITRDSIAPSSPTSISTRSYSSGPSPLSSNGSPLPAYPIQPTLETATPPIVGVPSRYTLASFTPDVRTASAVALQTGMHGYSNLFMAQETETDGAFKSFSESIEPLMVSPITPELSEPFFPEVTKPVAILAAHSLPPLPSSAVDLAFSGSNMIQELNALETSIRSESASQNSSMFESDVSFLYQFDRKGMTDAAEKPTIEREQPKLQEESSDSVDSGSKSRAALIVQDPLASPAQNTPMVRELVRAPLDVISQEISNLVTAPYDKARRKALREQKYMEKYPALAFESPKPRVSEFHTIGKMHPQGSCSKNNILNLHGDLLDPTYGRIHSPIKLYSSVAYPTASVTLPLTGLCGSVVKNKSQVAFPAELKHKEKVTKLQDIPHGRTIQPTTLDRFVYQRDPTRMQLPGEDVIRPVPIHQDEDNVPNSTVLLQKYASFSPNTGPSICAQPTLKHGNGASTQGTGITCRHASPPQYLLSTSASVHGSPASNDLMDHVGRHLHNSRHDVAMESRKIAASTKQNQDRLQRKSLNDISRVSRAHPQEKSQNADEFSIQPRSSSAKITSRHRHKRKKLRNQDVLEIKVIKEPCNVPSELHDNVREVIERTSLIKSVIADRRSLQTITALRQKYSSLYDDVEIALKSIEEHFKTLKMASHS